MSRAARAGRLRLLAALPAVTGAAGTGRLDPATGLVVDDHWELVRAHCTVCHSAQQVTQQRADRQRWLELIRWMQRTQGLWAFDPATEAALLDYLARHYGPREGAPVRRPPLAPELRPPAPAGTASQPDQAALRITNR